jgi:uncharacterized protein DUF5677
MNEKRRIVFGVPEFWPEVEKAFPKAFEVLPLVQESLNDLTGRGYKDAKLVHRVILNLGLFVGISNVELVTLVGNGLGFGALKIARATLESTINAEYLRRFPTECDAFVDWHWIEQRKLLLYLEENSPLYYKQVPEDVIQKNDKKFEEVRKRFENPEGKLRSSWCALNLADRAKKTELLASYKTIYPLGSQLIHGSCGALHIQFDPREDQHRIGVPPSMDYCREALVGGHMCAIKIVETLANTFNVKPVHSIEKLVEGYHYAWGKVGEALEPEK